MGAEMTIEDFARCVAEAKRSGGLGEMLAARALSRGEWAALRARFQVELEAEASREAFAEAYAEESRREVPSFLRSVGPRAAGPAVAPEAPAPMTDETAMLPAPEEIQRLIREADPLRAIPLGPRPQKKALSLETPNEWGETLEIPSPTALREVAENTHQELTVDAYAVIRATVAVRPREVELAYERYGIAPEQRKDVERGMHRLLENDRASRERFAERIQHFVGFLLSKQGT